jgi:TRAP-type C4-dicarboxylate transport system permease small subunit
MRRLFAAYTAVLNLSGVLFGCAIGVLIVLMTVEIALRYFGWGALPWLIEVAEYILCGGAFLAAPWVLREGAHIRIDMLLTALPRRIALRLEQALDAVACAASLVFFYYATLVVAESVRNKTVIFKSWWTPEWLVLLPVPIACALLAVEFAVRIARVRGVVRDSVDPAQRASL